MKKCDWRTEGDGDSEKALKTVVDYLESLDDMQIFQFGSQMAKLLYDLDIRELFESYVKVDGYTSKDDVELLMLYAVDWIGLNPKVLPLIEADYVR